MSLFLKSLLSLLITSFFVGCMQSNYQAPQKVQSIQKKPQQQNFKGAIKHKTRYKFKVDTLPGATIKIMNIKPKYHANIELKPGKYHIVVTKPGYKKYDSWITLTNDQVHKVNLKKISYPKIKNNYFKYVTNIEWNSHNERFSLVYDSKNNLIWALQSAYVDYVKKKKPHTILKDTLKVKKIRNIDREIYSCKLDTLLYAGNFGKDNEKYWRFKDNNTINICYKTEQGRSRIEKYAEMSHLNINGMTNSWFFPTPIDARRNNPFKKYQKYFQLTNLLWHNQYSSYNLPILTRIRNARYSTKTNPFLYLYNKKTKLYDGPYFYSINSKNCYNVNLDDNDMIYSLQLLIPVRKPNAPYDKIIFNTHYTPEQKLAYLTSKLTEEMLKVTKKAIKKPKKLAHIKIKKLSQGEFEKSNDFIKRVAKYKKEIAKKNKDIDKQNEKALQEYSRALEAEDIRYNKAKKHNQDKKVIKKTATAMAQKAMRMIFGDPKFSDITYNADKEFFRATLYSSSNNLKMKVDIPISISKAKKFKADLLDNKLVPVVSFRVKNNKLHFKELKIISNKAKIEKDLSFAKELDTPKAYKGFLKEYPNYKEKSKVKKMLQTSIEKKAYNKASSLNDLKAFIKKYPHSKYTKKAKKDIKNIEAQQKREAEAYAKKRAAYNATKRVGDKVCKDGTTAFILSITMKAFVERVNGENIQLRISDTEGTSPYYNGVRLYKNTLIWDRYNNWYKCN